MERIQLHEIEICPDNLRHHISLNSDFFLDPQYIFQVHLNDLQASQIQHVQEQILYLLLRPPPVFILWGYYVLPKLESLFSSLTASQSHCVLYLALSNDCLLLPPLQSSAFIQAFLISATQILLRSAFSGQHIKYTIWFGIHGPYLFSASISPIPVTYFHRKSFHIPCQPLTGSPAVSTEQALIHYLRLGKNMVFFGCVSLTPPTELVTVSP